MRRVVVTGMGTLNPLGMNVAETLTSLYMHRSGIVPYEVPHVPPAYHLAGVVSNYHPTDWFSTKDLNRYTRFIQLALLASDEAVKQSRLDADSLASFGVILGVGIGGLPLFEEQTSHLLQKGFKSVTPFLIPSFISNMASGVIAERHGVKGPNLSIATACASSSHAIGEAFLRIRSGTLNGAIVGGSESTLSPVTYAGFARLKAITEMKDPVSSSSCPFSINRSGFVMAEGAAILILESYEHAQERGVPILAEIVGYGATGDAYHMTAPHPDGKGALEAIRIACQDIQPDQVDYINAHGTSTPLNDLIETQAIKTFFGDHAYRLKVSSTKSATGHLLGGAGALECLISVLALQHQFFPATLNYTPDPQCDLDYVPHHHQKGSIRYALTNSFGFGGTNAVLLLKRYE